MQKLIILFVFASECLAGGVDDDPSDIVSVVRRRVGDLSITHSVASAGVTTLVTTTSPDSPESSEYAKVRAWVASGHAIVAEPPPPPPTIQQRRELRYRQEADTLLLAVYGYALDAETETDPTRKAALLAKRDLARDKYVAVRRAILRDLPE